MCYDTYANHFSKGSRENNYFDGIESIYVKEEVFSSSSSKNGVS